MSLPRLARFLLIIVVTVAAFSNSIGNPMLLDDHETIHENRQIRDLTSASVLMPERELPVAGRPLANVSFAMNYAFSGEAVAGYRVVNLAIHVLAALMVLLVLERLLALPSIPRAVRDHADAIALAATLFWAVHPINSEVIDYLTQRTESLMALCYLAAVYASLRALDSNTTRWTLAAGASCVAGALCKESIVTAPLAVVMLDRALVFPSFARAWARRRALYLSLAAGWVVVAGLQATNPRPSSAGFASGISPWLYLLNQARLIPRYLRLAFWPSDLVVVYGRPATLTLVDVLLPAMFVLLLLVATLIALRRRPALGAAGAWLFLTLAPASSLLPIATEVGAERRMYLPLVAIVTVVASVLRYAARDRRIFVALTAIVVAALTATTLARNAEYSQPLRLAEVTVQRWPSGLGHQLLAEELLRVGRRPEALEHLRTAAVDTPRAHFALGFELYHDNRLDEAIAEFQTFVRLEPSQLLVPDAEALIARAYLRQGRWSDAASSAQQALAKADNADARFVIASVQLQQSQFAAAIAQYRRYLAARPSDVDATTRLAIALLSNGQVDEGLTEFRRAADMDGGNWQTRRNLALALLDAGHPAEAIAQAQKVVALKPDDGLTHALLGQALARTGRRDEAVVEFRRALQLDPTDADTRDWLSRLGVR